MPLQRGGAGVVAVGIPLTASVSTTVNASHLLATDGYAATNALTFYNSASAATGKEMGTGLVGIDSVPVINLSGPLTDTALVVLNAMALGTDTVTTPGSGAYQHLSVPVGMDTELPFTSLYIKNTPLGDSSTVGSIRFDTCMLNQLTLTGKVSDVWRWSATWLPMGPGTAYAADHTGLAAPNLLAIPFQSTQFLYSTTTPTGVSADYGTGLGTPANFGGGTGAGWTNVDWSLALHTLSVTIDNGGKVIRTGGVTTGAGSHVVRSQRSISVTASFWYDMIGTNAMKSAIVSGMLDTYKPLIIRCITNTLAGTGVNYGFEYLFPYTRATAVASEPTTDTRSFSVTFTGYSGTLFDTYAYGWGTTSTDMA
jgi:hypothetical protein